MGTSGTSIVVGIQPPGLPVSSELFMFSFSVSDQIFIPAMHQSSHQKSLRTSLLCSFCVSAPLPTLWAVWDTVSRKSPRRTTQLFQFLTATKTSQVAKSWDSPTFHGAWISKCYLFGAASAHSTNRHCGWSFWKIDTFDTAWYHIQQAGNI